MIVITFFTHHAAQMTHRTLKNAGISAKMAPVPRALSSSCGSCVIAQVDNIDPKLCDEDTEAVYSFDGDKYTMLFCNE